MSQQNYISDEQVVKRANCAVKIALEKKRAEWIDLVKELFGSILDNISLEEAQEERLSKI